MGRLRQKPGHNLVGVAPAQFGRLHLPAGLGSDRDSVPVVVLLHGLVAGFIGPGPALQLVGALWLGVFLWFWISCLRLAEGTRE